MMQRAKTFLTRLHRDETGAMAVEKVLLIALIALPLIIALAVFRTKITGWFEGQQKGLTDSSPTQTG